MINTSILNFIFSSKKIPLNLYATIVSRIRFFFLIPFLFFVFLMLTLLCSRHIQPFTIKPNGTGHLDLRICNWKKNHKKVQTFAPLYPNPLIRSNWTLDYLLFPYSRQVQQTSLWKTIKKLGPQYWKYITYIMTFIIII